MTASSASASPPSPVPFAIARSMLSLGIEASRAFCTAAASAALASGSPPPSRAATVIARASLVKCWPPPEIFKAYDVRGLHGAQMDEEVAEAIGRAFARVLGDMVGTPPTELRVAL